MDDKYPIVGVAWAHWIPFSIYCIPKQIGGSSGQIELRGIFQTTTGRLESPNVYQSGMIHAHRFLFFGYIYSYVYIYIYI